MKEKSQPTPRLEVLYDAWSDSEDPLDGRAESASLDMQKAGRGGEGTGFRVLSSKNVDSYEDGDPDPRDPCHS